MEEMIEVTRRPWSALGTFMYAVRNLFNWDGSGRGELMGEESEGVPLVPTEEV